MPPSRRRAEAGSGTAGGATVSSATIVTVREKPPSKMGEALPVTNRSLNGCSSNVVVPAASAVKSKVASVKSPLTPPRFNAPIAVIVVRPSAPILSGRPPTGVGVNGRSAE